MLHSQERAILRQRVIASLCESLENDDEMTRIFDYAKKALQRTELDTQVLTVIDTACKGCVPSRIYVTDLCQNCVARPCLKSCHFDAITIQNGKASIDGEKCKNCTKCIQVCPYSAITKIIVPCENACPVNAINKNEYGYAEIDFDKCISCGACVSTCPFGAVHEKSQILDILKALKSEKQVVAMVAPSIVGQIPESINKVAQALIESGFSKVIEVALGADLTATNEAVDFRERMEKGDKFMTTSCCASYKELIKLHAPEIEPFVSETLTPMAYTAQIAKKQNPIA
jgi:Fe-S-cluster-containing hydrogenase component 2